jgi:predicted transcriptional regulator
MEPTRPTWLTGSQGRSGLGGMGSLESEVLVIVWEGERLSVRDVYETLRERRKIAYTTVVTVMGNLTKNGLLAQDRSGTTYLYTPAVPGDEVASMVLDNIVERLLGGHANVALSRLLGLKYDLDPAQTEELHSYVVERFGT